MAHSDGESDPLPWIRRNKASEEWLWGSRCAATRLDHGWVNCFRLIQRIQQPRRGEERRWEKKDGGREGGTVIRVSAVPFFTADKNICLDINLELRSSLPLLPRHPSSFPPRHHTTSYTSSPPARGWGGASASEGRSARIMLSSETPPLLAPSPAPHQSSPGRHPSRMAINSRPCIHQAEVLMVMRCGGLDCGVKRVSVKNGGQRCLNL